MSMKLDLIKKNVQHHGVTNVLRQYSLKIINKAMFVNVLTCIAISKTKPSSLDIDPKYEHGFLDNDKLMKFSKDEDHELPSDFLEAAISKGDECYAVTDAGNLASYGWYSNKDTLTNIESLSFCFDPKYIYMYKGLTKRDYRGQKLHAVGMSWALNRYLEKGFSGIVSYVEATNFDSLKSCWRMGYEKVGTIYIFKIFGKVFHVPSRSCRKFNIRLNSR